MAMTPGVTIPPTGTPTIRQTIASAATRTAAAAGVMVHNAGN